MGRRGRRVGLVAGYLMGATGAVLAVVAGVVDSMLVLLLGSLLLGATTAVNTGSRYAATDLATEEHRARALSLVVWASTIGAVAGPNLVGVGGSAGRSLGIPELTGGFAIGAVVLVLTAAWVWWRLRPDPLLLAQAAAGVSPTVGPQPRGRSWATFAEVVREVPAVGAAVVAMACAHAAMVTVMIMTPLHMEHGGAHLEVIGFVISVHVAGMFAFSPVVGWAADRFGRSTVLVTGGMVLLVSLALCGLSPEGRRGRSSPGCSCSASAGRARRCRLHRDRRPDPHRGAHRGAGHLRHGHGAHRGRRGSVRRGHRGGGWATRRSPSSRPCSPPRSWRPVGVTRPHAGVDSGLRSPRDTPRPNTASNTCSGYCASTGTTGGEVVHSIRRS